MYYGHLAGHSFDSPGRLWAASQPDGRIIVTASTDGAARPWDSATGQERTTLSGHTAPVIDATFSPDGRTVITASADKTAKLWDTATD
jgi:WD40 repeat protein